MNSRLSRAVVFAAALLLTAGHLSPAWAQQRMAPIGVLGTVTAAKERQFYEKFYRTLRDQGWVEGSNAAFAYASAPDDPSRFAEAAAELVRLAVDVIYADSAPAVRAAHAATRTIPIVGLDYTTDPIAAGYAASYGRPGGNVTGVFLDAPEFSGTWLDLLAAVIPGLSRVAVLWDPSPGDLHLRAIQAVAQRSKVQLEVHEVRTAEQIDDVAFRGRPQALVILPSPLLHTQDQRLVRLATKHRLPATSMNIPFSDAGGLIAYGPEYDWPDEHCAALVNKILRGAKPGDLPIERPSKFELIINLKTAQALGLTIPDSVLVRADKVIR